MNIGFDLVAILGPMGKNRGIGAYTTSEFRALIERDINNQYFAFNYIEDRSMTELFGELPNLHMDFLWTGNSHELIRGDMGRRVFENLVKSFLKRNKIDIFYITSPFDSGIVSYDMSWFEGVKVVATVYDVIPYMLKERYLPTPQLYKAYMEQVDNFRFADKLLAISQSVKTDLVETLNFSEDTISVIWGAPDRMFQEKEYSYEEKEAIYKKFGITRRFIMCTGGDDERKNLLGLIQAYKCLEKELQEEYQLVIVCKLSDYSKEQYQEAIKKIHLCGKVILTGFVTDDELVKLYNLASLMVFPSKYEGFGLPVVEAFACGTPVVTSNSSSLAEIGGDAAILIDPNNVKDIARGISCALRCDDLEGMVQKGKQRLELFQWPAVAERIQGIWSEIEAEKSAVSMDIKKKLAMFTPLPPIPSGISDYSLLIISELEQYFDIDIYIDDGYTPNIKESDHVTFLNHKEFKNHEKEYIDIIYQMGNSGFHFYMYEYIWKYPGTIVLHDYNLHGAFYEYAVHIKKNLDLYYDFIKADYDEKSSNQYIERIKSGSIAPKIYDMALNGKIVNYANKIIVHSDWSKRKLLQVDIGRCVRKIQLGVEIAKLIDKEKYRTKYGFSHKDFIIAAFGQIHQTKRNLQSLRAFSNLCKRYENLKLLCVGKLDRSIEDDFLKYVKQHNLKNNVVVTGFIPIEAFDEYITISDVCLNLRYPYQGETSGSLVRLMAMAKPIIVNDIGSFGEIPDDACIKIPDVATILEEEEIRAIEESLERLITNTAFRENLGKNAREFAKKELDSKIVAKDYKEFIEEKKYSILDEKLLEQIRNSDIIEESCDTHALAHTLAYMKE